jgi:hypothetical protein
VSGLEALWLSEATQQLAVSFPLITTIIDAADHDVPQQTESHDQDGSSTSGDWHSSGRSRITTRVSAGKGRANGDIDIVSTKNYTAALSSQAAGHVFSTAHGHFSVACCPDPGGVAAGEILITLQESVTLPDGSRVNRAIKAGGPFRFYNDDKAHLRETEVDLVFSAGSDNRSATNETDGKEWGVSFSLSMNMPGSGSPSVTPTNPGSWQGIGDTPRDALKGAPSWLLLPQILDVIARKVEEFWRSGKCIELKPTEMDRDVSPAEEISFTVEAEQKFDGKKVRSPITGELDGTKSLDPNRKPMPPPVPFYYVAGRGQGSKGSIKLEQIGKRGIGRRTLEFQVKAPDLLASCHGEMSMALPGIVGKIKFVLKEARLHFQPNGTYEGTGDMKLAFESRNPGASSKLDAVKTAKIIVEPRVEEYGRVHEVKVRFTGNAKPVLRVTVVGRSPVPTSVPYEPLGDPSWPSFMDADTVKLDTPQTRTGGFATMESRCTWLLKEAPKAPPAPVNDAGAGLR